MKTENTKENKNKFFAQYFGQNVLKYKDWVHCVENNPKKEDWNHSGMLLELKPLEIISDEDAKYLGFPDNISSMIKYIKSIGLELKDTDYLRSRGYALRYMDLSVQDLINYGWVKLIEST